MKKKQVPPCPECAHPAHVDRCRVVVDRKICWCGFDARELPLIDEPIAPPDAVGAGAVTQKTSAPPKRAPRAGIAREMALQKRVALANAMKDLCRRVAANVRRDPTRSERLVTELVIALREERVEPFQRLVFPMARAIGATFGANALKWIAEARSRPVRPRSRRAVRAGDDKLEARRLTVAAFRAIERVDGAGSVARARAAARAVGLGSAHADATEWLAPFIRPKDRAKLAGSNLKQAPAVLAALLAADAPTEPPARVADRGQPADREEGRIP